MFPRPAPDRAASNRPRWGSWPLRLPLVAAIVGQAVAVTHAPARAQAAEESAEEATVLLLPYLFGSDEAPAGYTLTETTAYPSETQAFEAVMIPPPDPRPMEALLTQLVNAGRVVRLRQGFVNLDDADAPGRSFAVAVFTTSQHASVALNDPSLLVILQPDAQVATIAAPALGAAIGTPIDGVAAFTVDQTFDEEIGLERTVMIA